MSMAALGRFRTVVSTGSLLYYEARSEFRSTTPITYSHMLTKSIASPGVIVPLRNAFCIERSTLSGGPRAALNRSTKCSLAGVDECSTRVFSLRSIIYCLALASAQLNTDTKTQNIYKTIVGKPITIAAVRTNSYHRTQRHSSRSCRASNGVIVPWLCSGFHF